MEIKIVNGGVESGTLYFVPAKLKCPECGMEMIQPRSNDWLNLRCGNNHFNDFRKFARFFGKIAGVE